MIETREQVLEQFRKTARTFLSEPSTVAGIDLDDASVTLKRYVLSELHDEQLGSLLVKFHKLIRESNVERISELVTEVESRLSDSQGNTDEKG
jgi:hypothetical protein